MIKPIRLLYAWEWGAGAGHLSRFEAISRELVGDGHQLILVVRDLTLARKLFPFREWGTSIEVRQSPTLIEPPDNLRQRPTTFAELSWNLGYNDADRTLALIEAWRGIMKDSRADGLIADFGLGAAVAAQSLNIPAVRIGTGFECPPPNTPFASLRLPYTGSRDAAIQAIGQVRKNVDSAVATIRGIEIGRAYQASIETVPQIVATVPELEHYTTTRADGAYVGMWAINRSVDVMPKIQGNRACFAYLKKSKHVLPLLTILAKQRYEVVLSGPAATIEISDGDVDRRIHRCHSLIDIRQLKSKIAFGITNANHGTTIQLLGLGIPVVAVPLFVEQLVTAHNLSTQRLGVLISTASNADIELAISEIESLDVLEHCQAFANRHELMLSSSLQTAMRCLRNWIDSIP